MKQKIKKIVKEKLIDKKTNKLKKNDNTTKKIAKNKTPKKTLARYGQLEQEIKKIQELNFNYELEISKLKDEIVKNQNDYKDNAKTLQDKAKEQLTKIQSELKLKFDTNLKEEKIKSIKQLLVSIANPILNLFKAIEIGQNQTNEHIKNYVIGFNMLKQQLIEELENNDVIFFNPEIGSDFNPNEQEQVGVNDSDYKKNQIIEVKQIGIKYKGLVIKPALVIISS